MKRIFAGFIAALALIIGQATLTSCGNNSSNFDYEGTPYVKYKLDLGTDFLNYYNVTVTVKSIDGVNTQTETINSNSWVERFENTNDDNITFYYVVKATLRDPLPAKGSALHYNFRYNYAVHWYRKAGGAKSYVQEKGQEVTQANLESYLAAHPVIEICNITAQPATSE